MGTEEKWDTQAERDRTWDNPRLPITADLQQKDEAGGFEIDLGEAAV